MARRVDDGARRALLDAFAGIHDHDPLGHLGDDAEIVGDQDQRHLVFAAELEDERHDLGLDGDVERGRGLVGDDQLGLGQQRDGDDDALAQPARKFVRVGVHA
ncbi:MAG: hypothetical protein M5U35_09435 [Roseovarius sp.]|nr:hypothetical protein [Roseovarius sp.]